MNGKDDDQSSLSETVQELENMLDRTSSANTLLRPQFWKMGVSRFCSGFSEQFLCSGSAHEVYPGIWIGNKCAAENTDMLVQLGISHLLNCAGGDNRGGMLTGSGKVKPDQHKLLQKNIIYKELPLKDTKDENIMSVFDDATEWIENNLKLGGKILVNCYVGSSRSATVVLAFLIKFRKMSLEDALLTIKPKRDIKPNSGFLEQLIKFERLHQHEVEK